MMKKVAILLTLIISFLSSNELKLNFEPKTITNAQTALLHLNAKNIKEPKLTVLDEKKQI